LQKFKDYVGGNVLLPFELFERQYGEHLLSAGNSHSVIVPLARHGSPSDSVIVLLTPASGHPRENGNETWLRRREELEHVEAFHLRLSMSNCLEVNLTNQRANLCFLYLSFNILSICWQNREDQTI
jgi:hypothetical protein